VVDDGFLMVNLWWNRGELWFVDGRVLGVKNLPLFLDLFFEDSHFGNTASETGTGCRLQWGGARLLVSGEAPDFVLG
jgi:hypothetical protein